MPFNTNILKSKAAAAVSQLKTSVVASAKSAAIAAAVNAAAKVKLPISPFRQDTGYATGRQNEPLPVDAVEEHFNKPQKDTGFATPGAVDNSTIPGSLNKEYGIQQFYTLVQQASGFARDMQMRVTSFVINGVNQLTPDDLIFVRTGNIPSKTISTQNVAFMGTQLQIPAGVTYPNPWNVTFYCTQDYNIRRILELSMLDTFNTQTNIGDIEPRDLSTYQVQLTLLNDKMIPLRVYTLYGAFVSNINEIEYDATGNGAIKQISAAVSYQYWDAQDAPGGNLPPITLPKNKPDSINKYTNLQAILGL